MGETRNDGFKIENRSEPEKIMVPFSPVKNTVLRVSPHFLNLPFDLHQGQPSSVGLFANEHDKNGVLLEVWNGHARSALLQYPVILDDTDTEYHDIDLKGGCYIIVKNGRATVERPGRTISIRGMAGLKNKDRAENAFYTN